LEFFENMKNMKNKLLEDNGHYWVKSKHDGKIEIAKYSKEPEGFNFIGMQYFMHIDNYDVISKIILRETNEND